MRKVLVRSCVYLDLSILRPRPLCGNLLFLRPPCDDLLVLSPSLYLDLPPDVHPDDRHVPGGLVPLLPGVPLGLIRGPSDYPGPHGHHRPPFCQVLHLLQPLHLCCCKQKVSSVEKSSKSVAWLSLQWAWSEVMEVTLSRSVSSRFRRAIIGMIRCQSRQRVTINTQVPMTTSQQPLTQ